jgi:hypothetical protein
LIVVSSSGGSSIRASWLPTAATVPSPSGSQSLTAARVTGWRSAIGRLNRIRPPTSTPTPSPRFT